MATKPKIELSITDYNLILVVFGAANERRWLLTRWEREFVDQTLPRFKQYGRRTVIRGKQMSIFHDLAERLGVKDK